MSKITNGGLTRSGTGYLELYPYGNSGRQRVNMINVVKNPIHSTANSTHN